MFVQKAMGYTIRGWATIMMGVLFLGGVQLICLGILGEYIGRIFNEIKERPLYIIQEVYDSHKGAKSRAVAGIVEERPGGRTLPQG